MSTTAATVEIIPLSQLWSLEGMGGRTFQKIVMTHLNTFCRGEIGRSFATDLLDVNEELDAGELQKRWVVIAKAGDSIRGFAFLESKNEGRTLYLHLICTAVTNPLGLRSMLQVGVGGAMLHAIKEFCVRNGFERFELNALPAVITLYHKFGWRFVRHCDGTEKKVITDAIGGLYKAMSKATRRSDRKRFAPAVEHKKTVEFFTEQRQSGNPEAPWNYLKMLLERNGFSMAVTDAGHVLRTQPRLAVRPGTEGTRWEERAVDESAVDYSQGMNLRDALMTQETAEEEGITETGQLVRKNPEDEGYRMLWCPQWEQKKESGEGKASGGVAKGGRRTRRRRGRRRTRRRVRRRVSRRSRRRR